MTAADLARRVRITTVAEALGLGVRGRRCRAVRRGGEGLSVSLDDARGAWYDFVAGEGGGVLDLVGRVLGCSRADSARWLADWRGVTLDGAPADIGERREMARRRARDAADADAADYWRLGYLVHLDALLARAKERLAEYLAQDADPPDVLTGPLAAATRIRARLADARGAELLRLYREYVAVDPVWTRGYVADGRADLAHASALAVGLVRVMAEAERRARQCAA